MKIEITVPTSLNEITLEQYQKFLKIAEENPEGNFLNAKMIEIFCGIPLSDSYKLKMSSVSAIIDILNEMLSVTPNHVEKFTLNGVQYGFIPDLDEMSLGEYIDLDNNIISWAEMHKAMNVLYRPIKIKKGDKYSIEDYDVSNPEAFFLEFRTRIIETYDTLFQSGGDGGYTRAANFGRKWGWYQSLYALAGGDVARLEDITKLNAHQCLTMLSFEKEKAEIEAQQIKSKF